MLVLLFSLQTMAEDNEIKLLDSSEVNAFIDEGSFNSKHLSLSLSFETQEGDGIRIFIYTNYSEMSGTYELQGDSIKVFYSHDGRVIKNKTAVVKIKPIARKGDVLTYHMDLIIEGDSDREDGYFHKSSSLIRVKAVCEKASLESKSKTINVPIDTKACAELLRLQNFKNL